MSHKLLVSSLVIAAAASAISPASAATVAYRRYHASSCWANASIDARGPEEIVNPFQPDFGTIYHSLKVSVSPNQYEKFISCPIQEDTTVPLGSSEALGNQNVVRVVGYDANATTWIGARLCRAFYSTQGGSCSAYVTSSFAATGNFNLNLDSIALGWNNGDPTYLLIEVDNQNDNTTANAEIRGYYTAWNDD